MKELDLSGLSCPIPIIITNRVLSGMLDGDVLTVTATDPLANQDFRDYCRSTGHKLVRVEKQIGSMKFHVQKSGGMKLATD